MAVRVGRIEVTVDADTGRMRAQIARAARQAERDLEDIEATPKLDTAALDAPVRRARQRIELGLAGIEAEIGASVDEGEVRRASREISSLLDAADDDVEIGADLDLSEPAQARRRCSPSGRRRRDRGRGRVPRLLLELCRADRLGHRPPGPTGCGDVSRACWRRPPR